MILPSVIKSYFSRNEKLFRCEELLQHYKSESELRLVEPVFSFINAKNSRFVSQRYQIMLKIMNVVLDMIENQQSQLTNGLIEYQLAYDLFQNQFPGDTFQKEITEDVFEKETTEGVFQKEISENVYFRRQEIGIVQNNTASQLAATNLVKFIKSGNLFQCIINPVLMIKTLKHAQQILHSSSPQTNHIIFEYIQTPDCIGKLFQPISLDILLNGQTNLSFCLNSGKNINSQNQTINLSHINPQPFCFFSIPAKRQRRSTNYRFLKSFQIVLNQTKGSILNQTTVVLPIYQPSVNALVNFTRYKNYGLKFFLLNSKSIDLIVCNFKNNIFSIICIDFICCENQKIKEKIRSFIKGFLANQDIHKTCIQFTHQNGQIKKIKVQVDYLIWSLNPNKNNRLYYDYLASELKKQGVNIVDKGGYFQCSLSSKKPLIVRKLFIVSNQKVVVSCLRDPKGLQAKKELIEKLKDNLNRYYEKKHEYTHISDEKPFNRIKFQII